MEVVERSEADVFVMENVPQLLGSYEYGEIKGFAEALGFVVKETKLCAADYGVPQVRWRAFIVGCRFADPRIVFPPKKTNFNPNNDHRKPFTEDCAAYISEAVKWKTVRDAIGDLPPPQGTEIRDVPSPV